MARRPTNREPSNSQQLNSQCLHIPNIRESRCNRDRDTPADHTQAALEEAEERKFRPLPPDPAKEHCSHTRFRLRAAVPALDTVVLDTVVLARGLLPSAQARLA